MLVAICQRYKLESNSQHIGDMANLQTSWLRYVKDTNLKAIHNKGGGILDGGMAGCDMSKIQT